MWTRIIKKKFGIVKLLEKRFLAISEKDYIGRYALFFKYKADKTGFAGFVGPLLAVVVHMKSRCLQISYLSIQDPSLNLAW